MKTRASVHISDPQSLTEKEAIRMLRWLRRVTEKLTLDWSKPEKKLSYTLARTRPENELRYKLEPISHGALKRMEESRKRLKAKAQHDPKLRQKIEELEKAEKANVPGKT